MDVFTFHAPEGGEIKRSSLIYIATIFNNKKHERENMERQGERDEEKSVKDQLFIEAKLFIKYFTCFTHESK